MSFDRQRQNKLYSMQQKPKLYKLKEEENEEEGGSSSVG